MLNSQEDSGGNFARGKLTLGRPMMPQIMNRLRMITESCDSLQGFIVTTSYGGGSGSGVGSSLAEKLSHEFSKQTRINVGIFPGIRLGISCAEPYNSLLFTNSVIKDFDVSVLIENNRLYRICHENMGIDKPSFYNVNRLVAQVLSSLTCNMRFDGDLCGTLNDLRVNLVPYPNLCFPVSAYAPLFDGDRANHATNKTEEYIKNCFSAANRMVKCPMESSRQLSTCMFFRGDFSCHQVNTTLAQMKKKKDVNFVDWCPTGFKLSFINQPSTHLPRSMLGNLGRSVLLLANTSAIHNSFQRVKNNVKFMLAKRAFFHWYEKEGLELDDFRRAYEEVNVIQYDYMESGHPNSCMNREAMSAKAIDFTNRLFVKAANVDVTMLCKDKPKTRVTAPSDTFAERMRVPLGLYGRPVGSNGLPFQDQGEASIRNTNTSEVDTEQNQSCSWVDPTRGMKLCLKCTREAKILKLRMKSKGDGGNMNSDIKRILCRSCRSKLKSST